MKNHSVLFLISFVNLVPTIVSAETYTVENPVISFSASVLPDKSILVAGREASGTMSGIGFSIEVGQVPCLLASLRGDFDYNFLIDISDLTVFVNVLLGIDSDPVHAIEADLNSDGNTDGKDIIPMATSLIVL